MSIVPASALSTSDLRSLGNNVGPAVREDHEQLEAVNRSLNLHQEHVGRLYRRSGHARITRLRRQVAA
jgi:hypothetical protein